MVKCVMTANVAKCRRGDLLPSAVCNILHDRLMAARFKERIREQTRGTRGISLRQMVKALAPSLPGAPGSFGDCQTPGGLQSLEMWRALTVPGGSRTRLI